MQFQERTLRRFLENANLEVNGVRGDGMLLVQERLNVYFTGAGYYLGD